METIYENIKMLRESKGLSQDALAELTGYTSRSSIAKIEKGLVDLPQSKIIAFAKALGVTPIELMGVKENLQFGNAYFDDYEYTLEELGVIKKFAEFIRSNRKKEIPKQRFTDVKEAVDYLKHETSTIAAFNGDTANEEVILQMANAIYSNRKK
jgi:transcriptional regulator with XRE-family HTH domain